MFELKIESNAIETEVKYFETNEEAKEYVDAFADELQDKVSRCKLFCFSSNPWSMDIHNSEYRVFSTIDKQNAKDIYAISIKERK